MLQAVAMPLAHLLFVAVNEQMKIVPIQVADERERRLWFYCGTVFLKS